MNVGTCGIIDTHLIMNRDLIISTNDAKVQTWKSKLLIVT
jgi:hypothetical protein